MSNRTVSLENVLARHETGQVNLDNVNADELKPAARFWFGPAAYKFRKADCVKALTGLFRDRARLESGLRSLSENERQVLALFKRYGGAMSGELLRLELTARGIIQKRDPKDRYFGASRTKDPVHDLSAKLLLISPFGGYSRFGYYYGSYERRYPDLVVAPGILDLLEPAGPWPWRSSAPAPTPAVTAQRSPAEVALDLWTLAQTLQQIGNWKTNRGGTPAKSVQNRLARQFLRDDADPLLPPDPEGLYYEILRELGAIRVDVDQGHINLPAVERLLRGSGVVQGWQWVRAWLQTRLWQDGIGVVPDRDRYDDPVRIEPHALARARELVTWALSGVAHGSDGWLDLEPFLADLWAVMAEDSIDFYWGRYAWHPPLKRARHKDRITAFPARTQAFWLDNEGVWAANAIMGTLAYLDLVERGHAGATWDDQPCFRLTPTGRAVFGAPELAAEEPPHDPKFLTVQPNFNVQVYLNVADASVVWPLAQMARRTSAGAGLVQTFALSRESVYQALESGLSIEAIRRFLQEHGRSALPDNVARSLAEWGRRREARVLRTDAVLAACAPGQEGRLPEAVRGRQIGPQFALLPKSSGGRRIGHRVVRNWQEKPSPSWRVDDEGRVRVGADTDALARARLAQFADPDGGGWRITAASVHRARDRGIPAEQILAWLGDHLENELPPILETALRNWSAAARIFFGSLLMLQVPQPQACAMIRTSRRFQPLLLGHIPPDWFIVRPEKQGDLERLLAELGFNLGGAVQLREAAEDRGEAGTSRSPKPRRRGRRPRPEE